MTPAHFDRMHRIAGRQRLGLAPLPDEPADAPLSLYVVIVFNSFLDSGSASWLVAASSEADARAQVEELLAAAPKWDPLDDILDALRSDPEEGVCEVDLAPAAEAFLTPARRGVLPR